MENETTQEQVQTEYIEVTVPEGKDVVVITVPEGVEVQIQHTKEEVPPAEPTKLDNILTLGMIGVLVLAVIAVIIRKAISNKKAADIPVSAETALPADAPTAPGSAGRLKLHNVEPKTAAMLMAIVADKLGKPINELRFISIQEVE